MSDPVARLNATLEGRYAIERELGEGGMATGYLADDLKSNAGDTWINMGTTTSPPADQISRLRSQRP